MLPKHIAPIINRARRQSCLPGFDRPSAAVDNALRRVAEGIAADAYRHDRKFEPGRFLRECGFSERFAPKPDQQPIPAEAVTEVCAHGGRA